MHSRSATVANLRAKRIVDVRSDDLICRNTDC